MNAADDKEASDVTPSCSNSSNSGNSNFNSSFNSNYNSGMFSEPMERNDCSRQLHSNGGICNGARPKSSQPLSCNIPNGISHNNYTLKLNNNVSLLDCEKVHNGNGMDLYMRNNVDYCVPIDKCPPKVRKQLNEASGNNRLCKKDDDSLSENEEEDEYCIYTYKGDQNQMADLPSSFFRLGVVPPGRENNEGRSSSPDMDYLEMDFDPGPSNGQGDSSDDSDCCDMQHDEERQMEEEDEEEEEELRRHSISPVIEPEAMVEGIIGDSENKEQIANKPENSFPELCPFKNKRLGLVEEQAENDDSFDCTNDNGQDDDDDDDDDYFNDENRLSDLVMKEPKNDLSGSRKSTVNFQPCSSLQQQQASHSVCLSVPSPSVTQDSWGYHCSSGDLCSPGDPSENNIEGWGESAAEYNLRSALFHCIMAKRLVLDKQASFSEGDQSNLEDKQADSPNFNRPIERTMIWSEQEACAKQVTQIGTSLCGATAVINVMVALNVQFSLEKLKEGIATRFRNENAPVPEYLFSRSVAGATHVDIIRGIDVASQGTLYAKFFHMYPERNIFLSRWLASWMKKGAIPIATINLQRGVGTEGTIPDVWHHQMIFGVGPRGIYLTNPLECVNEKSLMVQLCSPPVLKVRQADILSRWTSSTDLRPLIKHPDIRWKRMNVLGQVVNVIREAQWNKQISRILTSHVSIPASYSSGITLVIPKENPAYEQLRDTPDLLILSS